MQQPTSIDFHRRDVLRSLAAAIVGLNWWTSALAADDDPVDIVRQIYAISAGSDGKWNGPTAIYLGEFRRKYFSKAFQTAMTRMEAEEKKTGDVILDFDPISNSQDPSVKDLKIKKSRAASRKVTVVADFKRAEAPDRVLVSYDFIREKGGWKLDDIHGNVARHRWSVRAVIK